MIVLDVEHFGKPGACHGDVFLGSTCAAAFDAAFRFTHMASPLKNGFDLFYPETGSCTRWKKVAANAK